MVRDVTGKDNNSKERKLTLMMFSVVAIFIVCSTVNCVIYIFYWFDIIDLITLLILSPINVFFVTMNSSVNIFLYAYFCKPFRENLIAIFHCIKVKKDKEKVTLKSMKNSYSTDTTIVAGVAPIEGALPIRKNSSSNPNP